MTSLKHWNEAESRLVKRRNDMCARGATRDESIVETQAEQARNNRRYDGLMRNRRLTVASFK